MCQQVQAQPTRDEGMQRTRTLVSKKCFVERAFPFLCTDVGRGEWQMQRGRVHLYLFTESSAHSRSLVERVTVGRAFSWCKMSIRSEEQRHKGACVKDQIPSHPADREGGARRDRRRPALLFHFVRFSTCFSCCPGSHGSLNWSVWFPPSVAVIAMKSPPERGVRGTTGDMLWLKKCCFRCLSAGWLQVCGPCNSWRLLVQIWSWKWVASPAPHLLTANLFASSFTSFLQGTQAQSLGQGNLNVSSIVPKNAEGGGGTFRNFTRLRTIQIHLMPRITYWFIGTVCQP